MLASQAHQWFCVQDLYDQDKHYVMKTIPRNLFNICDQPVFDSHQIYANEPCAHSMSPFIPNDSDEVPLVRNDIPITIINMAPQMFLA